MIGQALDGRGVVVCAGPGGVGKTTVSAALALGLAREGRRVCVLTVDPARRLADALGIEAAGGAPVAVPIEGAGSLTAVMLDASGTFDALLERYEERPGQADAIRGNQIYRSLAGALAGTQEYMAMEELYRLHSSGDFDVVVVDTPPTRNALDLLDAPRRLENFLTNRVTRTLFATGRRSLAVVNNAASGVLRQVGKVVGTQVVTDALVFFQAFSGMEQGFRDRAAAVRELLHDPTCAYLLVTAPVPGTMEEAGFFAGRLAEDEMALAVVVANRCTPSPGDGEGVPDALEDAGALGELVVNFHEVADEATRHAAAVAQLVADHPQAKVVALALRAGGVASLAELGELASALDTATARIAPWPRS